MYLTSLKEHCRVMIVYCEKNAAFCKDKEENGAELNKPFFKRNADYWFHLLESYKTQYKLLEALQNGTTTRLPGD